MSEIDRLWTQVLLADFQDREKIYRDIARSLGENFAEQVRAQFELALLTGQTQEPMAATASPAVSTAPKPAAGESPAHNQSMAGSEQWQDWPPTE